MSLLTRVTGSILFLTNNCYCKLSPKGAKVKLYRTNLSNVLVKSEQWYNARFMCSESSEPTQTKASYITYDKFIAQRREEAQRSIVVQILSHNSCSDIYTYCSKFGKVKKMFHYTTSFKGEKQNFVLIEFNHKNHVQAVLSSSTHINHDQMIPTNTSMLWFRNVPSQKGTVRNITNEQMNLTKNSNKILDDAEINKRLLGAKSISDQMMVLYDSIKLDDIGTRLKFYTAYQIEHCFGSLFPNIAAFPFGSSVNGFGKRDCDLDLCLVLNTDQVEKTDSRLVFHTKSFSFNEKQQVIRMMELLAETINILLPGFSNVRKILGARVPIIKFDNVFCGTECDLAMSNMTAYYMSELLYMYGEMDWRVRPLTFTIRRWANHMNLVNKRAPGPWITNFSLTLMVLFYLQQKKILPSINLLKSNATKDDIRVADSCVDCTFQRDVDKMPKRSNRDSLETLLLDFFIYYSDFDFHTKALSLRIGKPVPKPQTTPLYICNPLENLNVSKNVSSDQLDRIVMSMRNAAHQIEVSAAESSTNVNNWGLLGLFSNVNNWTDYGKRRNLDFKSLFEKEDEAVSTS